MLIREEIEKVLNIEEIKSYLKKEEKKYIISEYKKKEKSLEKEYEFENSKDKIAIVVLYNIIMSNQELKNRKIKDSTKLVFSLKNLASITHKSEKGLYKLNSEFDNKFKKLVDGNIDETDESGTNKIIENLLKNIKKYRRKIEINEISNKTMINILLMVFQSTKMLYTDKTAIKIKEYLAHVQAAMVIAGYNVDEYKIEQIFCELSKHLEIEFTDGRNEEDFVKIKDIYGKYDSKAYIEFGR